MDWIFGYGSLLWRPGFPYVMARKAALAGYRRRFWQASPDHRGVPHAPGRVVTLVEDAAAVCWGLAFRPAAADVGAIIAELDVREQNGYERRVVEVVLEEGVRVDALTYVAPPGNPSFVGPAPLRAMAAQIARAHGPSGANRDYLLRLAETLDGLGVEDEEVLALRAALAGQD